jgi:hypothetical protein
MRKPMPPTQTALQCVECGRVSRENERGWTAPLTVDDQVAIYCRACDEREFGRLRHAPDVDTGHR